MNSLKLFLTAIFVVSGVAACGTEANVSNRTAATPAAAQRAATPQQPLATARVTSKMPNVLFADNCAACHKESGKGGKVSIDGKTLNPDDLTSAKMAAKTDDQLYKYIADGIPDEGMPAFKDKLEEPEIRNLVIHIRKLQGAYDKK